MNYSEFKKLVISELSKKGIEDYELYYSEDTSKMVKTMRSEVETFQSETSCGVCLRCICDGKMGYASTELFNEEQAVRLVRSAEDNSKSIEKAEKALIHSSGDTYKEIDVKYYDMPSVQEMSDIAVALSKKVYSKDNRVIDGTSAAGVIGETVIEITNSRGIDLKNRTQFSGAYAMPVMTDGKEMFSGFKADVDELSKLDLDEIADKAIEDASAMIGAEAVESGKYKAILKNSQVSALLHTFFSSFSASAVQKGLSLLKGKVGEKIASDVLTITDDPFYPECPVQTSFDAEGVATYTKNVVENGVLKTFLYNLETAEKDGVKSTGNGSKGSYASSVSISPYSFYVNKGEKDFDELLEYVKDGILITDLSGLHAGADPVSGDFSLQSQGFMIRDGKKAEAVNNFTVAGNYFELLKNIEVVGSDIEFGIPGGFTVFGSPSVVISSISVAGK